MKRFLTILFTVFYFTASSGVTVHMHYCMDKLVDVNFWQAKKESCNSCSSTEASKSENCKKCSSKKAKSKDCCQDRHEQLKIEKSQQAAQNLYKAGSFSALALFHQPSSFQDLFILSNNERLRLPFSNAPPLKSSVPTFILNCTFRI